MERVWLNGTDQVKMEGVQNRQSCLTFLENKRKCGGSWCKFLDIKKIY